VELTAIGVDVQEPRLEGGTPSVSGKRGLYCRNAVLER
jgi:hypothetical protein